MFGTRNLWMFEFPISYNDKNDIFEVGINPPFCRGTLW